jgi:hypothetical protein
MSTRRRLRRTLAAVAATIALPVATVVAPAAAHADGGIVVSTDGTICWEKGGTGNRPTVIVRLSEIAKDPVTVVLDTVNGTAVAPDDYVAISGLLVTVPAGASSVQVPLDIVADAVVEPDEWFFVSLSKPSVGQIGKNPATVIIKDGAPPAAAR